MISSIKIKKCTPTQLIELGCSQLAGLNLFSTKNLVNVPQYYASQNFDDKMDNIKNKYQK